MTQIPTEQALRQAGLRVTKQRVAVFDAVAARSHAEVDSVIAAVREQLGHVSTQAVYDVLHALTGAGLLREIQPAGSSARFDTRVGDNHHHLVCRSCQAVADVDCAVGAPPCLDASDEHGFRIDEAEVTFWGLCPDCLSGEQRLSEQRHTASTHLPPQPLSHHQPHEETS